MLNLYLAPRGSKAPVPNTGAVDALFSQLREAGILGPHGDEGWVPGPGVASLFHADAAESHLPAELTFDALELPGEPDLTLTAYSAEPGTVAADNLALLASWAATRHQAEGSAAQGSSR